MLLAEIHGKRFPEAEGQEDWLTSAVFGNLRHIPPRIFWPNLFQRALSVGEAQVSLASELNRVGVAFDSFTELVVLFWKNFPTHGEPDLILRFTGPRVSPLIVLVEVKLNSTKSSVGENDQLKKYLDLLDDDEALPNWRCDKDHRYLIYLTRSFAKPELEASVLAFGRPDAVHRMFGLEWRDVLETAECEPDGGTLLAEVAEFLKIRGFEAFRGFRKPILPTRLIGGGFYGSNYFVPDGGLIWSDGIVGRFYGL